MIFRTLTRALLTMAITAAIPAVSLSQSFPSKPIRLFIGYAAGGGTDSLARIYAPKLSEILGVPVVIENKPGSGELLAALPVMNSAPDGHTLFFGSASALSQGPAVRTDLPYDLKKNFTPVALIGEAQGVLLVRNDLPVSSVSELIAYAKSNPGKVNFGSSGIGSANHIQVEYYMLQVGVQMTHIPYKSDLEVTRDAMAGNVDFALTIAQAAIPLVKEGKLKAIAVTGPQRLRSLPQTPTLAEAGVPQLSSKDSYTFYGLMGPAGMPAAAVQRVNEAVNKVASMPEVVERLREPFNITPYVGSTDAYSQFLNREFAKWSTLRGKVKVGTN